MSLPFKLFGLTALFGFFAGLFGQQKKKKEEDEKFNFSLKRSDADSVIGFPVKPEESSESIPSERRDRVTSGTRDWVSDGSG